MKSWEQELTKQGLSVLDAAVGLSDLVSTKDQKELVQLSEFNVVNHSYSEMCPDIRNHYYSCFENPSSATN